MKDHIAEKIFMAFLALMECTVNGSVNDELIPSVFSEWEQPHTISTGELNIPVFLIEFADARFTSSCISGDELERYIFSEDKKGSLSSFYNISSYGNLHISGDVYKYTSKRTIASYEHENGFEELAMEVMTALDYEIDYSVYDADKNDILDAFVLNVPEGGDADFWYGCQATWYNNMDFEVDGIHPMYYIMCDAQPEKSEYGMDYYIKVLTHELGHCMGLPDYYNYYSSDFESMHGIAGNEIMDDMNGDFSQFSKLELGWLKKSQVQIYNYGNKESFILPKASDGGCILIYPDNNTHEGFSRDQKEYFVIEYDTAEKNFTDVLDKSSEGVRILHIRSDITSNEWDTYYTFNGYSEAYDRSENGIRIIRLINDGRGYYKTGAVIRDGAENFGWYDNGGLRKTKLTIRIGKVTENGIEVEISRNR